MVPKPHPSSRRKPEESKKEAEDVFLEKVLDLTKWAKANSQTLVLVGIIAVVAGAGAWYYMSYRATLQEQAVGQLEQVQASVGMGDRETAKVQLQQYIDRFEGTVYALEARLTLGQTLLEDGDAEGAIEALAPAAREMNDQPMGIQAGFLLAAAYEEAGRLDEAERMFIRISDASELGFQMREALSGAARLRINAEDYSGAAELFQDVLASLDDNSSERPYWEMRLAEANARS